MTFAEKKIAELKGQLEIYNQLENKVTGFIAMSNWLRKALAEAEREGQRQVYARLSVHLIEQMEYCKNKIKELEKTK